jgi:anthranilate phosphoribosyltransferase
MAAMGLAPLRHVGDAPDHLSRSDPVFVPVDILSPALARLLAIRARLGLRTIGHTLVKVLNPSTAAGCLRLSACAQAEGGRLLHEVFVRTQASALVLRGTEGEAVADARVHTRIDWLHEGRCTVLADAEPLPPGARPSLPPAHDARATARWIQSVLAGERPVPAAIDAQFDCVMRALGVEGTGAGLTDRLDAGRSG